MRLDFLSLNLSLPIVSNHLNRMQIESHDYFEQAVQELYNASSNVNDSVRLWSDENERTNLMKTVDVILSPMDLSFSGAEYRKKIIKLLISELEHEQYGDFINSAYSDSLNVFEKVVVMSDYEIEYEPYVQVEKFLKMMDVHLKEPEGRFIERIYEYIRNTHRLLGKELWFMANCSAYMNKKDYVQLEELIKEETITIVLLENGNIDESVETISKKYIVDEDICELYL